jgi:fumarate reductase (CoM/CoB) subunit A
MSQSQKPPIETDVVVVGSGGAGSEAAIHARMGGARVLILDRGTFGRSGGTITAGHTCTAAVGDDDTPELHFRDTVIGGYAMADQRLVEIYANEAPTTLHELDDWGGGQTFRKGEDGKFDLVWPPGGHSRKRSVHYGFMTGPRIMWALRRQIQKLEIPWMENILVTSVLTEGGHAQGVTALDWKTGEFVVVKAKAVVLAEERDVNITPMLERLIRRTQGGPQPGKASADNKYFLHCHCSYSTNIIYLTFCQIIS